MTAAEHVPGAIDPTATKCSAWPNDPRDPVGTRGTPCPRLASARSDPSWPLCDHCMREKAAVEQRLGQRK